MSALTTAIHRRSRDERGVAMISVTLIGVVISLLLALVATATIRELDNSARSTRRSVAYQAAEAGVDDYIAKLAEDQAYYLHQVHVGESTRRPSTGADVAAGSAWDSTNTWTYPSGKNAWRALGNGYEYNLQITPPSAGSIGVTILATGRRSGQTTGHRALQVVIRPASVADFQMIANANITYGAAATTRGKIYAGGNASNVTHYGNAYADLYAEGTVAGPVTYHDGAQGYGSSTIRTKIPSPILFSSFAGSLVDVKAAAQAGGVYLNAAVGGWKLVFDANGTVTVTRCTVNGGNLASVAPTCNTPVVYNVPSNGAIYAEQSVVVSGVIDGVVTVVSNDNIVVGGNISYETSGADVLGLIAKNNMYVANYVPANLDWRAATIAQTGTWSSYTNNSDHGVMTFTGSTATDDGGAMSMFRTRNYLYDTTLQFLRPPYFPFITNAYTVDLFREMPSGAV